jgi:hypothetical protein
VTKERRWNDGPGLTDVTPADWAELVNMVDLDSGLRGGEALGDDYLAIARKHKQTRQWKPDPRWHKDWYHHRWPAV